MSRILEVLILAALPASGKSEIRHYLDAQTPETLRRDFHLGPTIQLDDYPYVALLRAIDDALESQQRPRLYFPSALRPFRDPRDWGTLIELLNEDFSTLGKSNIPETPSAAYFLFDRLDAARERCGLETPLSRLPGRIRAAVATAVEESARALLSTCRRNAEIDPRGHTVILEFARGGPEGSRMPLSPPLGYGAAFSRLSEDILRRAVVLYIWVTPEDSRRKNAERGAAAGADAILHHVVPDDVMRQDYGCDDIDWLLSISETPDRIRVPSREGTSSIPLVRFDNRNDRTSFVRNDPATWKPNDVERLHAILSTCLSRLAFLDEARGGRSAG